MGDTWAPRGSTWATRELHVGLAREPHVGPRGRHVSSTWVTREPLVGPTWVTRERHVVPLGIYLFHSILFIYLFILLLYLFILLFYLFIRLFYLFILYFISWSTWVTREPHVDPRG